MSFFWRWFGSFSGIQKAPPMGRARGGFVLIKGKGKGREDTQSGVPQLSFSRRRSSIILEQAGMTTDRRKGYFYHPARLQWENFSDRYRLPEFRESEFTDHLLLQGDSRALFA